jgi:hypothetical protein
MDAALKKLNLGVSVWVSVRSDQDEFSFWVEELGYEKVSGKWGIALRRISGQHGAEDEAGGDTWLFNDAPRALRLVAIGKIPELLEQLSVDSAKAAADITKSLINVQKIAAVVKRAAEKPAPAADAVQRVSNRSLGVQK